MVPLRYSFGKWVELPSKSGRLITDDPDAIEAYFWSLGLFPFEAREWLELLGVV